MDTTFTAYYRRFVARLVKAGYSWLRDNVLLGLFSLIAPALIGFWRHSFAPDWKQLVTTPYVYLAIFILYVSYHIVRTPWKLDVDRQKDIDELNRVLQGRTKQVDDLTWPEDRPVVRFESWGALSEKPMSNFRGFYLANSGGTAFEIKLQDFMVGNQQWTGKTLPSIDKQSFMRVWQDNSTQFEKFGLADDMAVQCGNRPDYSIFVSIHYRDSKGSWYSTTAPLVFRRLGHILEFGPSDFKRL